MENIDSKPGVFSFEKLKEKANEFLENAIKVSTGLGKRINDYGYFVQYSGD